MFLQRLEIHGFKSFLDRTEIRFGSGITAIVGPNGCGKTNITDAIRWVLGEQSAKQLRGDTMEDVIFGGSVKRKPIGMAEVTLTLSNDRGALPTEYTEVQIGRRIFRSGNSEYSLNKTNVRLRDIRDLFYGTGMGSHAYSVIERSMVDHVLSDASGHRRFLFEEASGITKYKQRKREAINKLNATDGDLMRVQDIVAELDRELSSLARQVAKAKRAERLRSEIRDLDLRLSQEKHEVSFARERDLADKQQEETVHREAAAAELAAREAKMVTDKTSLIGIENELSKSRQALAEAESRRTRAENEHAVLGERAQGLDRQMGEIEEDRRRLEARNETLQASEEEIRNRAESFAKEAEGAQLDTAKEEDELARVESALRLKRQESEESKTVALDLMQGESERKAEWEGARARVSGVAERHLAARSQLEEILRKVETLTEEHGATQETIDRLKNESAEAQGHSDTVRKASEESEKELTRVGDLEAERREKLAQLRTRIETLEDLKESMEGLAEGVQLILKESKKSGARGIVADFLDVEPGFLDAVEALAGPLLGAAIVDSEKQAKSALSLLGDHGAGHASVVMLKRGQGLQSLRALKPGETGVVAWLREGVKASKGADGLVEVVVGDAILVETEEDAARLSSEYPGHRFVTRTGVVWGGGIASGGRASDADRGLLRRGQELKTLLSEREGAESSFEQIVERKLTCIRRRDERARELESAEADRVRINQTLHAEEARFEGLEKQLEAGKLDQTARQDETDQLAKEEISLAEILKQAEGSLAQLSREASDASRQLSELEEAARKFEHTREEISSRASQGRDEVMEIRKKHAEATADLARVEAELSELSEGMASRQREIEQAGERRREVKEKQITLESALKQRRAEEAELREQAEGAIGRVRAAREGLDLEEKDVSESRLRQTELAELVHQIEVERLTLKTELEKTLERLRVEYDVELNDYRPEPLPEGETWDSDEAEHNLSEARRKYESLGPVNLLALEDYNTKKERHDFLTSQRDDLLKAKDQLLEAIEKINTTASALFEDTFVKVEKNFQETFRTLFEGGECGLRRIGDDPLECEIEIVARPRGKSLQSILLLSSGERALTAIALLFSIYLVKPSPFCILDEVDAPLDDANVERFVDMLQRFGNRTQFIVVTHNKKTMEVAESLYGVTMQEPGVSKLVSVRFEKPVDDNGTAVQTEGSQNGKAGDNATKAGADVVAEASLAGAGSGTAE